MALPVCSSSIISLETSSQYDFTEDVSSMIFSPGGCNGTLLRYPYSFVMADWLQPQSISRDLDNKNLHDIEGYGFGPLQFKGTIGDDTEEVALNGSVQVTVHSL